MSSLTIESFAGQMDTLLALLRDLVEHESPSTDKHALDTLGHLIFERMSSLEATLEVFQQDNVGDNLLGTWGQGPGGVLLLVHIDTVYPLGTLASMPWGRDEDFVYGPSEIRGKVTA
jgi:glutamate carboxypeptidase